MNRRNFLKTSSFGAALACIPTSKLLGSSNVSPPEGKFEFDGLIITEGSNGFARFLFENLNDDKKIELVAKTGPWNFKACRFNKHGLIKSFLNCKTWQEDLIETYLAINNKYFLIKSYSIGHIIWRKEWSNDQVPTPTIELELELVKPYVIKTKEEVSA